MLWSNIRYYSQFPFVNLSRRAKFIFALRQTTLLVCLLLGTALLIHNALRLPYLILNFKHSDLASGLYDAIKTSSNRQPNLMMASEIKLLASYISSEIQGTPEKIEANIFGWCSINYNSVYDVPDMDQDITSAWVESFNEEGTNNITVVCSSNGGNDIFDFRGQLSQVGLNSILSYAYSASFRTDDQLSTNTNSYIPDERYVNLMKQRDSYVHRYRSFIIATAVLQMLLFFYTFFYYSLRGNNMDDEKIHWVPKNIAAVSAAIIYLLTILSFAIIISIMLFTKKDVQNELSSFGIYVNYGSKAVGLLITWLVLTTLFFLLWSGPVWCNRSVRRKEISNQSLVGTTEGESSNHEHRNLDDLQLTDDEYDDLYSTSIYANPFIGELDVGFKTDIPDWKYRSSDSEDTNMEEAKVDQNENPFSEEIDVPLNHSSRRRGFKKPPPPQLPSSSEIMIDLIPMSPILHQEKNN